MTDSRVEELYLSSIDSSLEIYYSLYDINKDGKVELLFFILLPHDNSYKLFSIWANPDSPISIASALSSRTSIDVYSNSTIAQVYINGFTVQVEGRLYRLTPDGNQVEEKGPYILM